MTRIGPFLLFDGNCAEAMEFYRSCFGGELTVTKLSDTPMKAQYPPEKHNRVVNARLKSSVIDITATDWLHPARTPKQGNTVCLYISEAPYPELKDYFDKLSEGADRDLLDNLVDMPFGSYGHLADKYGVHWFFQGDKANA
jgi:PhnB protein